MTIALDPTIAEQLNAGMDTGGGIELPFLAPVFWALNGEAAYKAKANARYFGGWACKEEDIAAVIDQMSLPLPPGLALEQITSKKGDDFVAYTTRSLFVAPISMRVSWIAKDGQRSPEYSEGSRRHVQALAFLGIKNGEAYDPWSPVVLSAKGYQAGNLLDAFKAWDKHITKARREIDVHIPSWCFYAAIGTFGKERIVVNAGKPGAQSPITPVGPYLPDVVDTKLLEKLFVGQDTATAMAGYLTQAREWLGAWKQADAGIDHLAAHQQAGYDNGSMPAGTDEDGEPFGAPPF